MEPLEGQSVIELSPSVVFPIVDRILGGRGQMISQARELTEIENRIVHRIILIILESLRRSWEQLIEFRLTVQSQESDPLIVQIVPGSDMVILVGYEMHVGEITGNMNLCIPLIYLNPVLDQISQQTRFMRRMNTRLAQQTKTRLQRVVRQASVPVDAVLGTAQLNVSDLATLEVGDVIPLDSNADGSIPVEISGLARFLARPGKVREQSAVQVERLIGEE
jgi:flagellar motor switch protein FliM